MKAESYMQRALILASLGHGTTWPNPMVGAVIVKDGRIIGEGYHERSGEDHAEAAALKNCTESPAGATLYVTLEPCCHTNKRTPPCAQALIREKIKKVVICNLDPNPSVNGQGAQLLKENGIEVEHGLMKHMGEKLNEVFFHAQKNSTPFVHLKLASTLDGKIALPSGESQWITGTQARNHAHKLRSLHQAVAVGAQTARVDNPKLNVRLENYKGPQPKRIIFTESGELPSDLQLLTDELKHQTVIYSKTKLKIDFPQEQIRQFKILDEALYDLFEKKIVSVLLEGGSKLAANFMQEKAIQRVSCYINPSFLGTGQSSVSDFGLYQLKDRPQLHDLHSEWLDQDLYLTGRIS